MIEIMKITPTGIKKKSQRFDVGVKDSNGKISYAHVHLVGEVIEKEVVPSNSTHQDRATLHVKKPIIGICPVEKKRAVVRYITQKENVPLSQYAGLHKKLEPGNYFRHENNLFRVIHEGKRVKSNFQKTKAGYTFASRGGACGS